LLLLIFPPSLSLPIPMTEGSLPQSHHDIMTKGSHHLCFFFLSPIQHTPVLCFIFFIASYKGIIPCRYL
jgi:hypothetical protein